MNEDFNYNPKSKLIPIFILIIAFICVLVLVCYTFLNKSSNSNTTNIINNVVNNSTIKNTSKENTISNTNKNNSNTSNTSKNTNKSDSDKIVLSDNDDTDDSNSDLINNSRDNDRDNDRTDDNNNDNNNEEDEEFSMTINDIFMITGSGTYVTGRIEKGTISVNDEVQIVGLDREPLNSTINDIKNFRDDVVDTAKAGENVGILLDGINKEDIEVGQVLVKSK